MKQKIKRVSVFRVVVTGIAMSILAGCGVAKVHVTKVDGLTLPNHRSIYYALPKTQLVLNITKNTTTTYHVEGHTNRSAISNACYAVLKKNKVEIETITKSGKLDIEVTPKTVPDAGQVYAVELDAGYFEDYDLDLNLDNMGIINGANITVVDNTDKVVVSPLATVATAVASGGSSLPAAATILGDAALFAPNFSGAGLNVIQTIDRSTEISNSLELVRKDELKACRKKESEIQAEVDEFEDLRNRLLKEKDLELIASGAVPGMLVRYESEIGRLEGALAVKRSISSFDYLRTIDLPNHRLSDCSRHLQPVLVSLGKDDLELGLCAQSDDNLDDYLTTIENTENLLNSKFGSKKKNVGLRYRVPMPTVIKVAKLNDGANALDCPSNKCEVIYETELFVPQYGQIVTLPSGLGNRNANFDATFSPDFGMVNHLKIASKGADPEPLSNALNQRLEDGLKSSDEKKQDALQTQVDYLTLLRERKELEDFLKASDDTDD